MLQFYMTPGSCSTGIHILLEELELPFAVHLVNLPAGDQHSAAFRTLNPKGTIPVLVVKDGPVLTEFTAIAWWLGKRHPKAGLIPEGVSEQAALLDSLSYIVGTLHQQAFTRVFVPERYSLREEDRASIEAQGRQMATEGFALIAEQLPEEGGYLFQRFTIADAALFYVEFWADRIGLTLPAPCRGHYQRMLTRPVVRRVLQEEGYRV